MQLIGSIHLVTCQAVRFRLGKYAELFRIGKKGAKIQLVLKQMRFTLLLFKLVRAVENLKFCAISLTAHVRRR